MKKTLVAVLCLLVNKAQAKPGQNDLHLKLENGIYVTPVTLKTNTWDADGYPNEDITAKMTISLYNNKGIIAKNCLSFTPYTNYPHQFSEISEPASADYLTFKANGQATNGYAILKYTEAYIYGGDLIAATQCNGFNANFPGVSNVIGIYPMNVMPAGARAGLLETYGLSFTHRGTQVEIKSRPQLEKADLHRAPVVARFNTDKDFITPSNAGRLLFDINTPQIGLPSHIYSQVVQLLKEKNAACTSNLDAINTCTYSGKIEDLPILTIGGLHIPPQVYVKDQSISGSTFQLEFVIRDPEAKTAISYINAAYKDAIVLGASYMKHYYMYVDRSNQRITLYNILDIEPAFEEDPKWYSSFKYTIAYIMMGIVGLLCIVTVYFNQKYQKNNMSSSIVSIDARLMNNHDAA